MLVGKSIEGLQSRGRREIGGHLRERRSRLVWHLFVRRWNRSGRRRLDLRARQGRLGQLRLPKKWRGSLRGLR